MYELYFEVNEELSLIDFNLADEKEVMKALNKHCEKIGFKCPYLRMWNEFRSGYPVTCIDCGSWSDFFVVVPALKTETEN